MGLAGCKAFIAAPRGRTAGKSLQGRAFLHDYDWHQDAGFGVLELIMTAPVVVASWISLQYYGSSVAPALIGRGNKLLHNVIGGIGVVEGNGGLLRPGLPWQSVHDGDTYAHEPLRLTVYIEAPRAAMSDVLERHPGVRALFDNRWLHLFALNETGAMAWRNAGDLEWEEVARERIIEADMRAHRNPARMRAIGRATIDLIRRARRRCPACDAPGYGLTERVAGLPCAGCGAPTMLCRADVLSCQRCGHRAEIPLQPAHADPAHCADCNP